MPTSLSSPFQLADLKAGERAILTEIHMQREIVCRMSSLGFTPGVELEMTQNYGHGPLVVTIRGTRVALGRSEARRAFVQRSEP